jgi:four helix bundle protein
MSAVANHAEARGAESRRDFIHKLNVCLKELRETAVWLAAIMELDRDCREAAVLAKECDELISIFVASVNRLRAAPHRPDKKRSVTDN